MTLTFTGVRMWDVINSAQPNINPKSTLRIVARANDGFKCVIRWHEIEPTLTHRIVLVAYEQDKEPLSSGGGPLRLVMPGDERGRRYLRGLAHLTVIAQIRRGRRRRGIQLIRRFGHEVEDELLQPDCAKLQNTWSGISKHSKQKYDPGD